MTTTTTDATAPRLAAVETAYAEATGVWTTADWTHEYGCTCGDDVEEHSEDCAPAYCDGGREDIGSGLDATGCTECPTCTAAVEAAASAEEHAEAAMVAARGGDWSLAESEADLAASEERHFGDAPVWGPFLAAVRRAASEAANGPETTTPRLIVWGRGDMPDALRDAGEALGCWCNEARDDLAPGWRAGIGWCDGDMPDDGWIVAVPASPEMESAAECSSMVLGYRDLDVPTGWSVSDALIADDNAEVR
jgi:hypothetical protein